MTKLQNCKFYIRIMGSKAYGYELPDSDFDVRGFYVQPWQDMVNPMSDLNGKVVRSFESLNGICDLNSILQDSHYLPAHPNVDVCIHSARQMFALWAKGSPEAFELLMGMDRWSCGYSVDRASVESSVGWAVQALLAKERHHFFSLKFVSSTLGFLESDRKKISHAKENYDEAKARKLVANMLRLSGNAVYYLKHHFFELDDWAQACYDIRTGHTSLHEAMRMIDSNLLQIKKLRAKSLLPKEVDPGRIGEIFANVIEMCHKESSSS